ncbi:MAG: hydroxymethylbilane synthase [Dehalococcoidia bacterium]|nr:hydroxymethylbilane synthase [Dehalococcoidia bacterium]
MNAPPRLRIATRGSRLALAQTHLAADALRDGAPGLEVEVIEITTEGDRDRETPLSVLGGRGVFVRGVEAALLDGRADVAVHSLKDVPTEAVPGLVLGAYLERGDPRDVFVGRDGRRLADLPAGARVGTSSSRRVALLRALRPDLEAVEIRGNVDTRLRKVVDGGYDGVVLAAAGLDRLDRLGEATQLFDALEFLPAPGQGAIALECRADDERTLGWLAAVDHAETRAAVTAERGFLAALGSGCTLPVGAYAQLDGDLVALRAMLGAELAGADGSMPVFGDASGRPEDAEAIGRGLGERLLQAHEERAGSPR